MSMGIIGGITSAAIAITKFTVSQVEKGKQKKKQETAEEKLEKELEQQQHQEKIDKGISAFREKELKKQEKWEDTLSESRNRYKEEGEKIGDMVNQQLVPREGVFTDQMYKQMGALSGTIQPNEKGYVEPELLKKA